MVKQEDIRELVMWREMLLNPELLGCLVVYGGIFLLAWIFGKIWD